MQNIYLIIYYSFQKFGFYFSFIIYKSNLVLQKIAKKITVRVFFTIIAFILFFHKINNIIIKPDDINNIEAFFDNL